MTHIRLKSDDAFALVIICTIAIVMFAKGYDSATGALALVCGACSFVAMVVGVAVIVTRIIGWFRRD